MRFYTKQHRYYCGIDLHVRTMYVCILDQAGEVLVHRNVRTGAAELLDVLAPYRDDVAVAVECMFTWYWVADLCAQEGIPFVLGHALYMKAIHGGKAKNDRVDALKIATLLRGGMIPQAYAYPAAWRATRDLLRRRLHLVRQRARLIVHLQMVNHQLGQPSRGRRKIQSKAAREELVTRLEPGSTRKNAELDLALFHTYSATIADLERHLLAQVAKDAPEAFHLLRTIPGVGAVLAMTILYEIHDIQRFDRVQEFASYARLVVCARESAGKKQGTGGRKIGNMHLKWAFSEAAVCFVRHSPDGKQLLAQLEKKHGKGRAFSILAHRLGRTTYFMLARGTKFEREKFAMAA